MLTVRIVSNILFYFARVAAWFYLVIGSYALLMLVLYAITQGAGVPVSVTADNRFQIFYPFTHTPFILGEYTFTWIFMAFAVVIWYGVFFWLLSNVFNTFRQQKLFTTIGVKRLNRFYILNLCVPLVMFLYMGFYGSELSDLLIITILHLILGIFAFFMASIFKQGVVLQEEQDLTL